MKVDLRNSNERRTNNYLDLVKKKNHFKIVNILPAIEDCCNTLLRNFSV